MKIGQVVYSINHKTKEVESWKYSGIVITQDDTLIHLSSGENYNFLPVRCVFETESEARLIAGLCC